MLPILNIEHLSKTYNPGFVNEMAIFSDFSLTIKKGQFVTIVGSNGSGKTSLLNLICGSLPIDSGKIILNGTDITNDKEYKRAEKIGRVFQNPSKGTCKSMTILENMAMADNKGKHFDFSFGVSKKRTDYYKTLLEKLRLGLQDKIDTQVSALSGGQRQALALLISTMTPLDLLILDEHTAALDPKTCENIMELTNDIVCSSNLTVLMVTHNLKYAVNYGTRIIMMHKGMSILDEADDKKASVDINQLLNIFNEISIELGN